MDRTEIALLRAFITFMHERSVSKSAVALGLSQPAASHTLARLRRLFDDPLLLPSRGGMVPTDRAQELEREVRTLLERFDALVAPAERFSPASSRRVFKVSLPEYAEHVLMPAVLRLLRAQAPLVRVESKAPNPPRAYEWLESGQIDLRIAWPYAPATSLRFAPLFQDRIVCVADRDHPVLRGGLTLEQLQSLPHLKRTLSTGDTTISRVIDDAVRRHASRLEQSFVVQHFLTVPRTVVGTDLIAMLPERLARVLAALYPLQILEPPLKLARIRYAAYWHERSHKDPAHRWFRGLVAQAAKEGMG